MLFKREIFYYQEINPAIILWKESTIGKETQSVTTLDLRVCEGERERERERETDREREGSMERWRKNKGGRERKKWTQRPQRLLWLVDNSQNNLSSLGYGA